MATKRLAKELGLVQICSQKEAKSDQHQRKQEFEYVLVLDFESTCWENTRPINPEIIEFPVVLLELSTGKILAEYQQFVLPIERPVLSDFCTKFTGISQSQVDQGVPLPTCLALFSRWLREKCDEHQFSLSANSSGKRAAFATWSDWDLGVCLKNECSRKNIKKPHYFNVWVDVRASYKDFYERKPNGLLGSLLSVGLSFQGREHSGICDAKNTAFLILKMVRDGWVLRLTKSLNVKNHLF